MKARPTPWADLARSISTSVPQRTAFIREVKRMAQTYRRELLEEQREELRLDREGRIQVTIARAFEAVKQSIAVLERAQRMAPRFVADAAPSPLMFAYMEELRLFKAAQPKRRSVSKPPKRRADRLLVLWLARLWERYTGSDARGPEWQQFQARALIACGSRRHAPYRVRPLVATPTLDKAQ